MAPSRDAVEAALNAITVPESDRGIIDADIVRALDIDGGTVRFVLEVDAEDVSAFAPVREAAEAAIRGIDGVETVSAVLTAHSAPSAPPDLAPKRAAPPSPQEIPGVERIIAIASGKGGVGKSTVASNLACALAAEGIRVGLLDADVYGPSQPRMLGVSGRPDTPDGKRITPKSAFGVTMMSIGLMMEADEALVWRGPMLMGALQQMLMQVDWGELDVLLVDLPPGTGDAQLTLAQKTNLSGSIIVSTPQDVALLDARKGINMFQKLNVPIVGMIENMSTHVCSNCGHEEHVFGHGGVASEAEKLGVPLLAEIPLHLDIRRASDGGSPIVVSAPDGPEANAFRQLARRLIDTGDV